MREASLLDAFMPVSLPLSNGRRGTASNDPPVPIAAVVGARANPTAGALAGSTRKAAPIPARRDRAAAQAASGAWWAAAIVQGQVGGEASGNCTDPPLG